MRRWLFAVLLLVHASDPVRAQTAALHEYQIKAVFLFNFAQFIEWPSAVFPESTTPVVIGLLGDDPFRGYLDETVRGDTVSGRPLLIQRYRRVDEVKNCHILFIASSEAERMDSTLAALRNRPILTVSDQEGFAGRGGMIQLFTERSKIRLRIDLAPAKAAGLSISSKLLRPAEVINRPTP